MTFETLGLAPALLRALSEQGYATPTPIQAEAIPLALAGHDLLGGAQTGTGKTAAFGLPLINHLSKQTSPNGFAPSACADPGADARAGGAGHRQPARLRQAPASEHQRHLRRCGHGPAGRDVPSRRRRARRHARVA